MKALIFLALLLSGFEIQAQIYLTRIGNVRFFSQTAIENIEAVNNQVSCIVNLSSGEVVSKMLMKSFRFEKALMEEHFNENYVESDLYPQASLNAKIANIDAIDKNDPEKQSVTLKGTLSIHGISNPVTIAGSLQIQGDKIIATSTFIVKPEDYNIRIPKIVRNNIAKEIEVSVLFELETFNQQDNPE
ncbi:MAG TPA: YceI family protein [Prolixibacteraceae bacterium]|nr:YceI family protein [Prolixibacteraceae bacterium]